MQKHLGIYLFLVASECKHNIGGYATLRIHVYLEATLPMSDKQGLFSGDLDKALVSAPLICKEFHELGLVRIIGNEPFSLLRNCNLDS